jgi:hypothetical protein
MTISYRFSKIEIKQFAIFPDLYDSQQNTETTINLNFAVNLKRTNIRCTALIIASQKEKHILILELAYIFDIAPEGWQEMQNGDTWKVPIEFLRYMGSITVGTARGIIHVKTEGTVLNSFILPPFNLADSIKEDYIIHQKDLNQD